MSGSGPGVARRADLGDLLLARLLWRAHLRWTLQAVLLLTAAGSLYFRVLHGSAAQVLPWWGGLPAIYFAWLVLRSSDPRCRAAYAALVVLLVAAFERGALPGPPRLLGVVEAASCVALSIALLRLAWDGAFVETAVLRSARRSESPDQSGGIR